MVRLTPNEIHNALKEFAASISDQSLGLAYRRPHPNALHTNCIANVLAVREEYGGQIRYGWHFIHRMSLEFGDYLITTHHAVWHNPADLTLVDVTPFHLEKKQQPITQDRDLLFLVDDNAEPFRTNKMVVPLPLRFHAIKADPAIQSYVTKLQHREYETYNQVYVASFS